MTKTTDFDQHRFDQREYGLSPTNPILMVDDYYDNLDMSMYDVHYDYEVGVVCSGRVLRKYRGVEIELGPGDVWVTGIWEPHGFELYEVPSEMLVFLVSPESIGDICPPGFDWIKIFSLENIRTPKISEQNKVNILNVCDKARSKFNQSGGIVTAWLSNLFTAILLCILDDNMEEYQKANIGNDGFVSHDEIKKVIDLVFRRDGNVSVAEAAAVCMMSISHFSRVFKKATGITFARFTLGYRIKKSAASLAEGKEPIKKIASDWGFKDASHYTKSFEKFFGMTPSYFRKHYHEG